jgi:uncharacterized protein
MKHMSARLAAILGACLVAAGPILAPVAFVPEAHAQQPPSPGPASNPNLTQSQIDAGRTVVVLSGMVRSFDSILPQYAEQVRQTLVTRPDLTKDLGEVLEKLKPELEQQKSEMVEAAARIYASRLSEAELKDIGAFFSSPSGKRYVETQPLILDDMFVEMQSWTQRVSAFVIDRVRAEMKKRGHEL